MAGRWSDRFEEIWKHPQSSAKNWKAKTKKKVIGWAIPDGPEELILASASLPVALLGAGIPFSRADAHFQGFACSYTRSLLELLARGEMEYLDALILPHTCDALRAFDLVVKEISKIKYVETFRPPRIKDNAASVKYLKEELERMRKRLGEITGHYPSLEEIRAGSETINNLKAALNEVKKQMKAGRVKPREYFSAVQAGMVGEKEEITKLVQEFLKEASDRKPEARPRKIVLAGKVAEPIEILDEIEASGFQVVDDLLVNGSRYVKSTVDLNQDPIQALADAQLAKMPVAGMYDKEKSRGERIIQKVRRTAAHAVIFLVQKFCEPYEIDVVGVEEELKKAGIPMLKLESDYQTSSVAPLRTRIDAFAEMLTAKS